MAAAPVLLEQRDELAGRRWRRVCLVGHLPQGGSCHVRAEAAIASRQAGEVAWSSTEGRLARRSRQGIGPA